MCCVVGFWDFYKMLIVILRIDVFVYDIFEDEISGFEVFCWVLLKGYCEFVQILVVELGFSVNICWDKSIFFYWVIQL